MQFDADGREVPKNVLKEHERHCPRDLDRHEPPFISVKHEATMTVAHREFSRRARNLGHKQNGSVQG
ncbi:MAG: hypothetical protein J0I49_30280 [Pseudonocardia sp.]|uniref:hypothetical protein n=1 Tax=Pseudonocardia sp. TaxID=60912 RepID=UPI001AC086EA|nr:hypothetical protein [Pseudonocardia sp.]MBN9102354.1 hypothetical protein [Pseudonocardia sp.]